METKSLKMDSTNGSLQYQIQQKHMTHIMLKSMLIGTLLLE